MELLIDVFEVFKAKSLRFFVKVLPPLTVFLSQTFLFASALILWTVFVSSPPWMGGGGSLG